MTPTVPCSPHGALLQLGTGEMWSSRAHGFGESGFVARVALLWAALTLAASAASNGIVFSSSINVPNLGARTVFPIPSDILDPLAAGRVSHWRCRYEDGRLVEVSRRDADHTFRPMQPPYGVLPAHGYLFKYSSATARKPDRIVTPADVVCRVEYDDNGFLVGLQFPPGLCGTSCTSLRLRRSGGRIARASYWKDGGPDCDWYGVHAREYSYDERGFLVDVRYVDRADRRCNSELGIARRSYVRGRRGEWNEIAFWSAAGTRTTDWHGVARYVFACNEAGQEIAADLYGPDGTAATNLMGACRLEWQYDDENLVGTRAFGPGTNIVFDGPPLIPDLFQRTWADTVIVREKEELALPIWRFIDYAELGRAYERCQARLNSTTQFKPFYGEQMRVLAEYLCLAHAGPLALYAACDARAAGMTDPRWCALALLPAGVMPHPSSDAAQFVTRVMRAVLPEHALLFTSDEQTLSLMTWATHMRNEATNIIVLDQSSLADATAMNTWRTWYGSTLWLPSESTIRTAVRTFAQLLDVQGQSLSTAFSFNVEGDRVRLRGREGAAQINLALFEQTVVTNRPLRVFCEDLARGSFLVSNLVPTGPLFEITDHFLTDREASSAVAFWASLEREIGGMSGGDNWHAARRLMARHAAAQARLLFLNGKTNDAARIYAHAHTICPDDPIAHLVRAADMLECGDFANAREEITAASGSNPSSPRLAELQRRCGLLYRRVAQITALEAMPDRHPTNTLLLAQLYKLQGNPRRAIELALALMPIVTNEVVLLDELADLCTELNRLDCAEACLASRTRAAPDDFIGWTRRAAIAFAQRKAKDGIAFLHHAAMLDRPRLRRMLDRERLAHVLETQGITNLVLELDQMVAPPRVPSR